MSLKTELALWYLKRQIKKELKRRGVSRKERRTTMKGLNWLVNLQAVPSGMMTLGAGWLGILMSVACFFGVEIPGCPMDPGATLLTGLIGIGLGRRK